MLKNRFREKIFNSFTMVPNFVLDGRLSHKAIGILVYLLSRPEGWNFNMNEIKTHFKIGIDALRTAIKELEDNNILIRIRERDEKGRMGKMIYILFPDENDIKILKESKEEEKKNSKISSKKEKENTNKSEEKSNMGKSDLGESKTNNIKYNNINNNNIYKQSNSIDNSNLNMANDGEKTNLLNLQDLIKKIDSTIKSKGGVGIKLLHAKFGRTLLEISKNYSLEDIDLVIDYLAKIENDFSINILSNPNSFLNNFEAILSRALKENHDEEENNNDYEDEFSFIKNNKGGFNGFF